jgi:Asp-tRNA(Asn)/Glu-tRNA(Gln) amidotransferase A subunit family amidase
MSEITALTASELLGLYRGRKVSPVEVVEACLARIGTRDVAVRAWEHLDAEHALAQARSLRSDAAGLLYGVPIGFKDIVDTAELPTAYGSPIYAGHRPGRDAVCVTACRAAGGLVLGKTVTTEFAGRNPGKTAHPLNPLHTPGGSSSGSAAAVADRHVYLAIGSQTAGSTIRPAGYCGVHALTPSRGSVSFGGMKHLSERLDTIGLFARSVPDLALFRAALVGAQAAAITPLSGKLRAGLCRTPYWERASLAVRAAIEAAASQLEAAGIALQEIVYPDKFGDPEELCWQTIDVEVARNFAWDYERRRHSLSAWMRASIERGMRHGADRHEANLRRLAVAEACFDAIFETVDILLAPAAGEEAPFGLSDTGSPIFNLPFHIAGLPAVNLPIGVGPGGLPIGLQIIGPRFADGRLLDIAAAVESRLAIPSVGSG